ncbi:FtsX-like permease family protein [bacterium]|nr:MAG: FtsX-like permease family protein [bacterium]
MLTSDLFQETYLALLSNKSRSALTILGIVIGIASVIALVSIGQGATQTIQSNIEALGSNLLVVTPGSASGPGSVVRGGWGSAETLNLEDAESIRENISNIDAVAPTVSARKQIISKGKNTNTSIYGIDENYFGIKNINLALGEPIAQQNIKKLSRVAVLGPTTYNDLFGEDVQLSGQQIRIDNQQYTVIGVTEEKGGSGFTSSDDLVYIPISTAQQYLMGNNTVSNINIQVSKEKLMDQVQEEISQLLLSRHGIEDPLSADFTIMNQADIMDTMSSVTDTLTLLLGSIAGISLIVGGIGIMNMMLTIVTERTREIGLRKSLGARRKDISRQFLTEAIALTLIGGIVGILLGCTISILINKFAGMTTSITPSSIFLAFGVAATIGIIFGYYPARRASKLSPINALRYE